MALDLSTIGPIGRTLIERDEKVTTSAYSRVSPLVVSHAKGSEVWDMDGRRYIDFMTGIAVTNVGHCHPYVVEKTKEALDQFWHICLCDFYYPQAVELAEKLERLAPMSGKTRVFFSNSGTEAIEAAIKLAMYSTGRNQFVGFRGSFHGRTLGALSFTTSKYTQRAHHPPVLPVHYVPYPNAYRPILAQAEGESYGDTVLNYLENELFMSTVEPTDIAAVLVEPIQGAGGYIVPARGFFPRLRDICDKYGILLIVDEVQSGMGRTGKMWCIEHEGVEPDILCFAKGIANGLPLGGIIAKEACMTWKASAHGTTFGGNPVTCAAGSATIDVIEQEALLARAQEMGSYICARLSEMQTRHPSIGNLRGRGLMIGLEFVSDRVTKAHDSDIMKTIIRLGFEKGLLLLSCGRSTLRIAPALNIPRPLVDEGLALFEQALTEAERLHGYQG